MKCGNCKNEVNENGECGYCGSRYVLKRCHQEQTEHVYYKRLWMALKQGKPNGVAHELALDLAKDWERMQGEVEAIFAGSEY